MNIFFQASESEFCDRPQSLDLRKKSSVNLIKWKKENTRMSAETYSWDSRIAFVVRYMYGE